MKKNNSTNNDYDDGNIPDIDLPKDSVIVPDRIKITPNGAAPADRSDSDNRVR